MQHQEAVNSAAFSPDGRRVVTASEDRTAQVWETDTGTPVSGPLQHQNAVNSAAFSPDGRRVVTASRDNTARVWTVLLACCTSPEKAARLASLAEAVSRYEVSGTGSLTVIDGRERLRTLIRQSGTRLAPDLSLDGLIRRFSFGK
jgi:WD40 repeat protein